MYGWLSALLTTAALYTADGEECENLRRQPRKKKKERAPLQCLPSLLFHPSLPPPFFVLPVPLFCIFILLLTYSAYLSQVYFKPLSPIP